MPYWPLAAYKLIHHIYRLQHISLCNKLITCKKFLSLHQTGHIQRATLDKCKASCIALIKLDESSTACGRNLCLHHCQIRKVWHIHDVYFYFMYTVTSLTLTFEPVTPNLFRPPFLHMHTWVKFEVETSELLSYCKNKTISMYIMTPLTFELWPWPKIW